MKHFILVGLDRGFILVDANDGEPVREKSSEVPKRFSSPESAYKYAADKLKAYVRWNPSKKGQGV